MASIVVLAHRVPYPPNKGEKLRTFHQIEGIIDKGHDVKVVAPCETQEDIVNAQALAEHFNIEVFTQGLSHRAIRLIKSVLLNQSFSEQHFYSAELHKQFLHLYLKADVVLLTASSLIRYLPENEHNQKLVLMDFMDVDSDKWFQYARQSSVLLKHVYTREAKKVLKLEAESLSRCHTTFVISSQEYELLKKSHGDTASVKVLGNGIDQQLFSPVLDKPDDKPNFLFTGVMDYKPNVDAVLWFVKFCWPDIKEQVRNASLTIAGMNPSQEIQKLKNDSSIEVTGFVDDIKPYFDRAHIFVAPFRIARGVQNKVLQAMASGLPVVSTALGAEGIKCISNRDIIIVDDAEAFSRRAIELMKKPDLRIAIGQEAVNTINNEYAWPSVLTPLTSLIGNYETHT